MGVPPRRIVAATISARLRPRLSVAEAKLVGRMCSILVDSRRLRDLPKARVNTQSCPRRPHSQNSHSPSAVHAYAALKRMRYLLQFDRMHCLPTSSPLKFSLPSAALHWRFIAVQNHIRIPATSWNTLVFSPAALRKFAVSPKLFSQDTPT